MHSIEESFEAAALSVRIAEVKRLEDENRSRLRERWRGGKAARYEIARIPGGMRRVRLEPTERCLAVGTPSGEVNIYSLEVPEGEEEFGRVRTTLTKCLKGDGLEDAVHSLDIEGDFVISGAVDGTVRIFDVNSGACLLCHKSSAAASARTVDGKPAPALVSLQDGVATVAVGSWVSQYELLPGTTLKPPKAVSLREHDLDEKLCASCLAVAGDEIWIGTQSGLVLGLKGEAMETVAEVCPHAKQPITALCAVPRPSERGLSMEDDPSIVFTGSSGGEVARCLFFAESDTCATYSMQVKHWTPRHLRPVVALQTDGQKLVSGSLDGTVRAWDGEMGKVWWSLGRHSPWLGNVHFVDDWLVNDGTKEKVLLTDFRLAGGLAAEAEDVEGERA